MRNIVIFSVTLLVVTTGCLGVLDGGESGLDKIPSESNFVINVDGDIVQDQNVKRVSNAIIDKAREEASSGGSELPEDYEDVLDTFQEETNFEPDLRDINEVYIFGDLTTENTESGYGIIVNADWRKEAFLSTLRNNTDTLREETYKGTTMYGDKTGLASYLGDKNFVISENRELVESTIDVNNGDSESISGKVPEYIREEDTEVRFAFETSNMEFEEQELPQYNYTSRDINMVSGYLDSKERQIDLGMSIKTTSQQVANEVRDSIEEQRDNEQLEQQLPEEVSSIFGETTVETDNSEVNIRNSININEIVTIIEKFGLPSLYSPLSPEPEPPEKPEIGVDFTHEGSGVVTAQVISLSSGTGDTWSLSCNDNNQKTGELEPANSLTIECESGETVIATGSTGDGRDILVKTYQVP